MPRAIAMWSGKNQVSGRQLVLGKYRVLAELGHGGMADLYLAMSEGPAGFSKLFVIKRLRNADDPQHVAMFLDEARLAARLSHPNIVQTYEIGEEQGGHFLVMEHLPGPTVQQLRQRYAGNGRVPPPIELEIMCNVLEGLHHAHELCGYDGKPLLVVHRDLSPENVIITRLGECKVLDFGIAKTLESLSHTEAGFYKGKLTKMPPEQMLGETVDRRADIFAAGVMLWEGLAGRSLWGDLGGPAIAHCLASREIPPLPTSADVPEDLKWICARAIHAHPEGRWSTAQDFRGALLKYMQQHNVTVSRAQLGAFVEPLFADERERLSKILEAQLLPRDRVGLATGAGTMPLPRRETASGRLLTAHSDPYYARLELEGFPTKLEKHPAILRTKAFWGALGAAAFAALAIFGVQRFLRAYEVPQTELAPIARPAAPPAHPVPPVLPPTLETPPTFDPNPSRADDAPPARPVRAFSRRNRALAARRQAESGSRAQPGARPPAQQAPPRRRQPLRRPARRHQQTATPPHDRPLQPLAGRQRQQVGPTAGRVSRRARR